MESEESNNLAIYILEERLKLLKLKEKKIVNKIKIFANIRSKEKRSHFEVFQAKKMKNVFCDSKKKIKKLKLLKLIKLPKFKNML